VNLLVLDASIAFKWVCPSADETLVDEALELAGRYADGTLSFVVPDLFWAELANVLWKSVRTGRLTQRQAEAGLALVKERGIPTVSSLQLVERALMIASSFGRTAYDSLYIALAMESAALFVTADKKLANAVGAHLPVVWLGAL